jgi:hypothetical protein
MGKEESLEKEQLERKLERAQKRGKSVEKNKKESLERREEDLKRRTREQKEKFKNLEQKKKLMKTNPSEDFKRAIERWHASLVAEQEALDAEKVELKSLKEDLGLQDKKYGLDFLPFIGEVPTEIERVRQIEAKKLYKISNDKKSLLEDKEFLYKQHGEVASLIRQVQFGSGFLPATGAEAADLKESRAKLEALGEEIKQIEDEVNTKTALYEKHYGKPAFAWMKNPVRAVSKPTAAVARSLDRSLDFLNPFGGDKRDDLDQTLQALLERRMHLKEKLSAQQNLVDTLSEAFNAQLAIQEKKRLLTQIDQTEKVDIHALRKTTKKLERDIRKAYEEIEDRHNKSKEMLGELDAVMKKDKASKGPVSKAAQTAAAPVVGAGRLAKAFFVGLPHKEVELTQSAAAISKSSPDAEKITHLREQIELESRIIDAKHKEILNKQRELEVVKAKASLAGGFKFRRTFVKVPYIFVGEAIENARRVIPKKDREEILINRLNDETKKLEALKAEIQELEKQIPADSKPAAAAPAVKAEEPVKPAAAGAKIPSEESLKKEIEVLLKNLEIQKNLHEEEGKLLDKRIESFQKRSDTGSRLQKRESKKQLKRSEKLRKELKEIEDELSHLIEKESKMQSEESVILEKRIKEIDKAMKKVRSRALSQDLLTERERMEERFSELQSRRDFLSKELKRFEIIETAQPRT